MSSSSEPQQRDSGSGDTGASNGIEILESNLVKLDEGEILDPIDDITANGEVQWLNGAPAYHDLDIVSYTKYDAQEWMGRVKKYKMETVQQGDRVRRLEYETRRLKADLDAQTLSIEEGQREIDDVFAAVADVDAELNAETQRRQKFASENLTLKRHLTEGRKAAEKMLEQSKYFFSRMRALEAEMAHSKERYESCLGEKERLRLEREWFFRERIFLEETTIQEERDAVWDELKLRLAKLRHSMHRAWGDAKRDDVRGQLRAARWGPLREEWFASRKRMYMAKDFKRAETVRSGGQNTDEGSSGAQQSQTEESKSSSGR